MHSPILVALWYSLHGWTEKENMKLRQKYEVMGTISTSQVGEHLTLMINEIPDVLCKFAFVYG